MHTHIPLIAPMNDKKLRKKTKNPILVAEIEESKATQHMDFKFKSELSYIVK